ncbi:MAG: PorT family protein [Cyclobacteriaceae bacterium]|nr:PorT family protein [Cyclobacteriaceae bacterium]
MKHVIIAILSLFVSGFSFAQGFEAYAIGGTTFSQIDGDNLAGYNNFGFIVGGASNFLLANDFSFQQEIVYFQRGSRATEKQFQNDVFTNKDLRYIDFITLLNKQLKDKWIIQAGIGAGKLIGIKTDDTGDDIKFYRIDVFGTIGGGYFITENLLLNVRLQYTINSIQKDIPFVHNNSMTFTLRWRFMKKD